MEENPQTLRSGKRHGGFMTDQLGQHGGWVFSVYEWRGVWWYQATKETLTHTAKGTVKAINASEAIAAVQGLIDSGNLNQTELKEK